MASSWKNSHFGTQKMLLGRNEHPPGSERKERNECIKRGTKKSGAKKKSEGEGKEKETRRWKTERWNRLTVKRGESEQRHCRINIPFV